MILKNNTKLIIAGLLLSKQVYADTTFLSSITKYRLLSGYPVIEIGGMVSEQGKSQSIRINGLVGDRYSVKDSTDSNPVFGMGYFIDYPNQIDFYKNQFNLSYGISAYYLFPTKVEGTIKQEHTFENFKYEYRIRHLPLYLATKITSNSLFSDNSLLTTLNLGLGPSFIKFSRYREISEGGINIPNNLFTDNSDVVFSFTAGVGLKSNNLIKNGSESLPIECGYKFFFFTESHLQRNNSAALNSLKSGNSIVHALTCGVQFGNLTLFS